MNQWVKNKQENKQVDNYLINNGYNEIAIYGMSFVGETLLKELQNTEVKVKYCIDKNAEAVYLDNDVQIEVRSEYSQPVDAIVVTAVAFFNEIQGELNKYAKCPIISLEDILYEM